MKNFIEKAQIESLKSSKNVLEFEWNEHPKFKGVFLKNIINGADTSGKMSCHFVKINPNCEIGDHTHNGLLELHEIIEGSGKCSLGEKILTYEKGIITIIPSDINHKVKAGNDGLLLMAKFVPPLT